MLTYRVTPGDTSTALAASSASPAVGSPVTYTATVTAPRRGFYDPNDSVVVFMDGTTPVNCGGPNGPYGQPIDANEHATCTVTYTAAGTHAITAQYQGDGNFNSSTSPSPVDHRDDLPAPTPAPTPAPAPDPGTQPHPGSVRNRRAEHRSRHTNGPTASLPVSCAKSGPSCTITVQITATELMQGGKVIGVIARKKITHKVIVLGSAKVTLAPGQHKTLKITLNSAGKQMLASSTSAQDQADRHARRRARPRPFLKTVTFKSSKKRH